MEKTVKVNLNRFLYHEGEKRFIKLYNGLIIGRDNGDINFPSDKGVSTQHLRFSVNLGEVSIIDLKSTNTTLVNGVKISSDYETKLNFGDLVEVSNQRFFLTDTDKAPPKEALAMLRGLAEIKAGREGFIYVETWPIASKTLAIFLPIMLLCMIPLFWGLPVPFWPIFYSLAVMATFFSLYFHVNWAIYLRKKDKSFTFGAPLFFTLLICWFFLILFIFLLSYSLTFVFGDYEEAKLPFLFR